MSEDHFSLLARTLRNKPLQASLGDDNLLVLLDSLISPCAFAFSLWALAYYFQGDIFPIYIVISVIVFALSYPGNARLQHSAFAMVADVATNWAWLSGLLLLMGFATGFMRGFSNQVLTTWLWVAPLSDLGGRFLLRYFAQT